MTPERTARLKWGIKRARLTPKQLKLSKKRNSALVTPITAEDVIYHSQYLVGIPHGGGMCWHYARKSTGGASNCYARLKFHGVWVMAHRFAMAAKLNCRLIDLDGFDVAHAPFEVCAGGRCCHPDHIQLKTPEANRSWDKARDLAKAGAKPHRTKAERAWMVRVMYPTGIKIYGALPPFLEVL
jgi:hypothetical protein